MRNFFRAVAGMSCRRVRCSTWRTVEAVCRARPGQSEGRVLALELVSEVDVSSGRPPRRARTVGLDGRRSPSVCRDSCTRTSRATARKAPMRSAPGDEIGGAPWARAELDPAGTGGGRASRTARRLRRSHHADPRARGRPARSPRARKDGAQAMGGCSCVLCSGIDTLGSTSSSCSARSRRRQKRGVDPNDGVELQGRRRQWAELLASRRSATSPRPARHPTSRPATIPLFGERDGAPQNVREIYANPRRSSPPSAAQLQRVERFDVVDLRGPDPPGDPARHRGSAIVDARHAGAARRSAWQARCR